MFKPMPPAGEIVYEGIFKKKKEQRANDALFLKGVASYFENNCEFFEEAKKLREIAKRLEK